MRHRVNIGCGRSPTEGWINFDNSPAIKLAASPFKYRLARLFGLLNDHQIENIEWNRSHKVRFADATKRIPLEDGSAECVYTSHMLEHLSRDGARRFLEEARRVLMDSGILRVAVPDLTIAIEEFRVTGDADRFMESILVEAPPINTLQEKFTLMVSGYRHHQWMYDGASLRKLMSENGFRDVTLCQAGQTMIENPVGLDARERIEESVYVEGVK